MNIISVIIWNKENKIKKNQWKNYVKFSISQKNQYNKTFGYDREDFSFTNLM